MFYSLGMFPYPSGTPHLGHVRVYTLSDVRARHARMHHHDVLHPIGWDAFGLPAENAAIARGVDPEAWTRENIAQMRRTFRRMGWSFDQDREICTADPAYYRWTQWLFQQLHAHGLAYRAEGWVHWCPSCATVLADEQVTGGVCWRCEAAVERRQRQQWMLRITRYAQALWDGLEDLAGWDPRAVAVQRNWIRRSEGAWAAFGDVEVFSTRMDTLPGVVAVVVAPEHPLARDNPRVAAYVQRALRRSAVERLAERDPSGVPLGIDVPHPLTGDAVPVWVADYVIGDYGTGAVMCVPVHDDRDRAFTEAVGLPAGSGVLDPDAVAKLEERGTGGPRVSWNLRDWSVGRQRRWGCPIPIVWCRACGEVPAALPVRLEDPVDTPCPACGGAARRETDTLDTFVCSAWYAFRFTDPHNAEAPFDREAADRWLPIDVYVGGIEHAAQHMLYFRFVTRFLHDLGRVAVEEPVDGFVCNGMVLGTDGKKMSKRKGNGPDPDAVVDVWGADALRLAVLADTPVERDVVWEDARVEGKGRFLERFAAAIDGADLCEEHPEPRDRVVYELIDAIDRDIAAMALHVAVARAHDLARALRGTRSAPVVRDALRALWPLVPTWVEARWRWDEPVGRWPVAPAFDAPPVRIVVQVDGRVAGTLEVAAGTAPEEVRARAEAVAASRLEGRAIARIVDVPDRLVNFVTAL